MRLRLCAIVVAAAAAAGCSTLRLSRPEPIRVLVLNMHAGKDAAGRPNLDGVAALVKATGADVVLLQEVDRGTARSGQVDQVDALAQLTGYSAAFGPSLLAYDGGEYGIAVLAREVIGYRATLPLPVSPVQTRAGGSREPRVALLAFLTVRGSSWRAITTHLDPVDDDARAQEVARVADYAREQQAGTPLVVGGDFNSIPANPVLGPLAAAGLRDAWLECGKGDGFTYPAAAPAKRIDYLFLTGELHCTAAEVLETQVSDHRPLLVTIGRK
jgi:endonuclease/exonuclease/phosphatase family metal-dependent hydrolase